MKTTIKNILLVTGMMLSFAGCNKYVLFTDSFVAFDVNASSATSVDASGSWTGVYYVDYTGETQKETLTVTFSVKAGDGLVEGIDYEMVTKGNTLSFLPGIFTLPIRIKWLSNPIDTSKDNSLTISLESSSDPETTLGMPGPDALNKSITIHKYV
ncbi:MAG: hypothetical protein ACI395_03695 [Candidatus Cryptobacteroides sp.]